MSKARGLADLGNAFDDGALSNRNLIINGAMQVAQRGTSFSGLTSGYTLDRWATYQTTAFLNQQQDADAPDGFNGSLKTTVATASTPSAGDLSRVVYNVEAQDVARLGYGTADAQTTTLSFWVKSSVTGNYTIFVYVNDPNRSIVKGYSINAANTWEYKTITISGDTAGSGINNDNGNGISFEWNLLAGSTYNTAGAQDTWVTGGGTRASGQTANCGASGATWQITGVQLEVGDTATPFEHRSYGDELARCRRYYYQPDAGTNFFPTQYQSAYRMMQIQMQPSMRTTPTLTYTTVGGSSWTNYNLRSDQIGFYVTAAYNDTGNVYIEDLTVDAEL